MRLFIRPHNQPRAKVKQVHQNNLKYYFRRGHTIDHTKIDHTSDIDIVPAKRQYRKDLANRRWRNAQGDPEQDLSYDAEASETESEIAPSQQGSNSSQESSNEPVQQPRGRGRPKGAKNKVKNNNNIIPPPPPVPTYTTRSGRIIRPQNKQK